MKIPNGNISMLNRFSIGFLVVTVALAGCAPAPDTVPPETAAAIAITEVSAFAETAGSAQDDGNDVAFWIHPTDPKRSLVLVSAGTGGLESFTLDGVKAAQFTGGEFDFVDVTYGVKQGTDSGALVIAYDRKQRGLWALTIDPVTLAFKVINKSAFTTGGEVTGLCTYRSPVTGDQYAFAAANGLLEQWKFYGDASEVKGILVRTIPIGDGSGYCATDPQTQSVYVTEESVGIWRLAAEPEFETNRTAVDLIAPFGALKEEVKGIAIYRVNASTAYLLATDVGDESYTVYSLADHKLLGRFNVAAVNGKPDLDAVGESEGIAISTFAFGGSYDGGLIAIFDESNEGGSGNAKLVRWSALAQHLKLLSAQNVEPLAPAAPEALVVTPEVETAPVEDFGDAADDIAIWVHPTNPALSLVIGTNKKRGLDVYDLSGKRIQVLEDGRTNNVDLREGFELGGKRVALVAVSNRTFKSLGLYRVDPQSRRLVNVADGVIEVGLGDPYGLCMYKSAKSGNMFALVNDSDGRFKQFKLIAAGGKVKAELVREFALESQTEGCVADDENGALYLGEEDAGLWRYSAEPDGGSTRVSIDTTAAGGHLTADVEGMGLYVQPGGKGFLVVSSQGSNDYAVYRREDDNAYVGRFSVAANDTLGIDGISETDGLDVSSANLGGAYAQGIFIAQDGRNITPAERQNFKFVPWAKIAATMKLQ
jgi:3-phytase